MLLVLEEKKGAIDGSAVVEHTPNQLEVKDLSPARSWREKGANKVLKRMSQRWPHSGKHYFKGVSPAVATCIRRAKRSY